MNLTFIIYNNRKIFFQVFFLFFFTACKPRISLSGSTLPEGTRTVSVGYFANDAALSPPVLPQIFSEKLRDMISRQTPLRLVASDGDIRFEGSIVDFQTSPVSVQAGDVVGKNRLTITVWVRYVVKNNEALNYEENFTRFADFDGNAALSQVQNDLMQEISRQICEDIFNKSFNNW